LLQHWGCYAFAEYGKAWIAHTGFSGSILRSFTGAKGGSSVLRIWSFFYLRPFAVSRLNAIMAGTEGSGVKAL
jgi:hypothetical protein